MSTDTAVEATCGCMLWLMLLVLFSAVIILGIGAIIQALRWISHG